MIDWRDDQPRWKQLVTIIRLRIESGEYPAGRMLTERGLMEEFGVAKVTARKTFAGLRERGLVYTRHALGSFVGPDPGDEDE